MPSNPIAVDAALDSFSDHWSPRIIASFNDFDVRVAKVLGDYVWHAHDHTDELFLVLRGVLHIDLREAGGERTVTLQAGSLFVVPRGVTHRPRAELETSILLLDPAGTTTTGDYEGALPAHIAATAGIPIGS